MKKYLLLLPVVVCLLRATPALSITLKAPASDTLHLRLQDCIRIAKEKSPTARAVKLSYESRRHSYHAIMADYYPQISLSLSAPGYSRVITPVVQADGTFRNRPQEQMYSDASLNINQKLSLTGGDISIISGVNNRLNLNDKSTIWQSLPFLVQLRQPIFGFNAYSYTRDIEMLRYDVAQRAFREQIEDVAIDAAGKFFDCYIASMNVNNARLNVSINDSIFVLAKGRYNVGKIAENDLLQNELAVLNAQTELERSLLEEQRSMAALRLLLDLEEDAPIDIQPPTSAPRIEVNPKTAVNYALLYRSDIRNVEVQQNDAERTLAQTKAANRFSATVTASYGVNQTASEFNEVYKNPLDRQQLSLGVELPLFTWGKNSEQVESAEAEKSRVDIQSALQRRQIEQEVFFQVKDFLQLQQQITIAEKGEQIAARGYDIAKNRYIIGKIETTELMLAQQRKDDARRSYFQTLRNFWTSYYRLRRITLFDFVTNKAIMEE